MLTEREFASIKTGDRVLVTSEKHPKGVWTLSNGMDYMLGKMGTAVRDSSYPEDKINFIPDDGYPDPERNFPWIFNRYMLSPLIDVSNIWESNTGDFDNADYDDDDDWDRECADCDDEDCPYRTAPMQKVPCILPDGTMAEIGRPTTSAAVWGAKVDDYTGPDICLTEELFRTLEPGLKSFFSRLDFSDIISHPIGKKVEPNRITFNKWQAFCSPEEELQSKYN